MREAGSSVRQRSSTETRLLLPDIYFAWRDRILASARFQRWAATFPLTRLIARRRSGALFDICAGFVYSQVLLACVRVRLFEVLAKGPITGLALAQRLDLPADATDRLLKAAVSLDLASHRGGGRYGLGSLGAALLGNPAIPAMVEHHALLYADLADPVSLLRGHRGPTGLGNFWPYARSTDPAALSPEQVDGYSRLMSISQALIVDDILDAYPLDRHRSILDVGGGDGSFLLAAAARTPKLTMRLLDLPPVAARARAKLDAAGLTQRATAIGGDFLTEALPHGADVISLIRVLHDHDDEAALRLLVQVQRALPPDGVLLLAEPIASTPGAVRVGDAYFAFYLLAMGSGRARTAREIRRMLRQAGFGDIRQVATARPFLTSVIVAKPTPAKNHL